jgi:hypothetical protein
MSCCMRTLVETRLEVQARPGVQENCLRCQNGRRWGSDRSSFLQAEHRKHCGINASQLTIDDVELNYLVLKLERCLGNNFVHSMLLLDA